jgi:hypothetical protein
MVGMRSREVGNLKIIFSWALVLTPVILATREAVIRRIEAQGQPGQKTLAGIVVHACHLSFCGKHKWVDHSAGQFEQKMRPYIKNNQSKKGCRHG